MDGWPSFRQTTKSSTVFSVTAPTPSSLIWSLTSITLAHGAVLYKKIRISIEWNYATTGSLFKYIALPWKLRLVKSVNVAKVFTVCTILKNCHAILYGCQSSNYFNVSLPDGFIDYYVNQEDLPNK